LVVHQVVLPEADRANPIAARRIRQCQVATTRAGEPHRTNLTGTPITCHHRQELRGDGRSTPAGCSEDQIFGVVVDGIDRATAAQLSRRSFGEAARAAE
jgi:hypothetical protein